MKRTQGVAAFAAVVLLAACGDNDNPQGDVGVDTDDASDVALDGSGQDADDPDGGDDADDAGDADDTDAVEETSEDAGTEICDDGEDNDDDALVDCDDDDCETDEACVWSFDFPEPQCDDDSDCEEDDAACVGGSCRPAVAPDAYTFGATGVVRDIYIPSLTDEDCCFDLDGDGDVDNAVAELVSLWNAVPDSAPLSESFERVMEAGLVDGLVELGGSEESPWLSLLAGNNDLDLNGHPDVAYPDRHDTLSTYVVLGDFLGSNGPAVSLYGEIDGAMFTSTWADFDVVLPSTERCSFRFHVEENWVDADAGLRCRSERGTDLHVSRLRAEMEYEASDAGLTTVDGGEDETVLGGLKVGGYVGIEALAQSLSNTYYDQCACVPGMDADSDFFVTVQVSNSTGIVCADVPTADEIAESCSESQRSCAGIPTICATLALPIVSNLPDFDSDGDDVLDSMSFGVRIGLSPATIADPSLAAPAEICVGGVDEDGDGRIDCDDPYCWDDRNCGGAGHSEDCNDGLDNTNANGLIDCDDGACRDNLACVVDEGSGDGDGSGD